RSGTSAVGTVVEIRDDGRVVVEVGNVRLVADPGTLAVVPEAARGTRPPRPASPQAGAAHATVTDAAASEISIRGLRVDGAEAQRERAIDAGVLAALPYLRVIHGKGTGALRELVHATCERDPRVRRFGFAPANQGGAGVTVIEFRA